MATVGIAPNGPASNPDGTPTPVSGLVPVFSADRSCIQEVEQILKDYASVIEDVIAPKHSKGLWSYWSSWPYSRGFLNEQSQIQQKLGTSRGRSALSSKLVHQVEQFVEQSLSLRLCVWKTLICVLLQAISLGVVGSWTETITPADLTFTILAWFMVGLVSLALICGILKTSFFFTEKYSIMCILLILGIDICLIAKFCSHHLQLKERVFWILEILILRGISQLPILQESHLVVNWTREALGDAGMLIILVVHFNYADSDRDSNLILPISLILVSSMVAMISRRQEILDRKGITATIQRIVEKLTNFLSILVVNQGVLPVSYSKISYIPLKNHQHKSALTKFVRTRIFKSRSNIASDLHPVDSQIQQAETPVFEIKESGGFGSMANFKPTDARVGANATKVKRNLKWIPAGKPGTNIEDLPVSPISYVQELESTRRGLESSRLPRDPQPSLESPFIAKSAHSGTENQPAAGAGVDSVPSPDFRGSFQTFSFAKHSQVPVPNFRIQALKKKVAGSLKLDSTYLADNWILTLTSEGEVYKQAAKSENSHPVLEVLIAEVAASMQRQQVSLQNFMDLVGSAPVVENLSKHWRKLESCSICLEGLKADDSNSTPKSKEQFLHLHPAKKRGSKTLAQSEHHELMSDTFAALNDLTFVVNLIYNASEAAWEVYGSFMAKPNSKLPWATRTLSMAEDSSAPQDESIMQQTFAKSNFLAGEDMNSVDISSNQNKNSKFMTPQLSSGSKFQRSSIMKSRQRSITPDENAKQVQFAVERRHKDGTFNNSRVPSKKLLGKRDSSASSDESSFQSGHNPPQTSSYEDIVAVVVHDMRSPLGCILGNLQLIDFEIQESIQMPSMGQSNASSSTPMSVSSLYHLISPLIKASIAATSLLETLVNDMLDAARISKGIFRVIAEDISLKQTLEECLQTLQIAAKSKHLTLSLSYAGPEHIYSDKQRIKQVVLNFLTNAIKFTQNSGKIEVVVLPPSPRDKNDKKQGSEGEIRDSREGKEKRETIKIEVRDNGEGIKPDVLEKLFEKFNSNRDSKTNGKGLGLGLFICKSIVETLGPKGNIKVQSQVGSGTTIAFELYSEVQPRPEFENESFKILRVQDSMGDINDTSQKEQPKSGQESSTLRKEIKLDSGTPIIGTGLSNMTISPRNRPRFETSVIHFKPGLTSSNPGMTPAFNKSITNDSKLFGKSDLDTSRPRMEDIFKLNDAGAQISKRIIEVRRKTVRMGRLVTHHHHKSVVPSTFLRTSTNTQKQLDGQPTARSSPKSHGDQDEQPSRNLNDSPNSIFFEVNDSALASGVRPLNILLVEDEPALMDLYEHYCERFQAKHSREVPVEFLHATSIEDGKRVLSQISVDVVVTDYSLPDGTGLNLAQQQLPASFAPPLFVLASGERTFPPDIHQEIKSRFFKVLEKPVALKVWMDMLLTCIQQVKHKEPELQTSLPPPVRAISVLTPIMMD